jgi:hypothetical protein
MSHSYSHNFTPEAFRWRVKPQRELIPFPTSSAVRDEHFILCKNNNLTAGAEEKPQNYYLFDESSITPAETLSAIFCA